MGYTRTIEYIELGSYKFCKRIITSSRGSMTTEYYFIEKFGKEIFRL